MEIDIKKLKYKFAYKEERDWLEPEQKREREVFYEGNTVAYISCKYCNLEKFYFYEITTEPNSKIPWTTLSFKSERGLKVMNGKYQEEFIHHPLRYSTLKECKEAILEEIRGL